MAERGSVDAVRILLVSTVEDDRSALASAVSHWERDHRLFWVSQPELAPIRAEELVPNVVLVDGSLPQGNAIPLIDQLVARVPSAAILLLVEPEAMDIARRGVLAGARGFVPKPIQATDLVTTLRQVLSGPRPRRDEDRMGPSRPSHVIVFCSPKGGTGRTTLATNTAVTIRAITDEELVLIDADYVAPSVDVVLNLPLDRSVADLVPRLARLDDVSVSTALASHASGISVLLAPPPGLLEPLSSPQVGRILVLLRRMFPWVVVDLGLPFDESAFAFLDSADAIVMSVAPELTCVRNVGTALDTFHERAYPDGKIWLVLNSATERGGVPKGDIERRMNASFRHTIPDDRILVTHSLNRGVPVVISHPRSAVGRAIRRLGREMVKELTQEAIVEAEAAESGKGGLLRRSRRKRAAEGA